MKLSKQNIVFAVIGILLAGLIINEILPKNQSSAESSTNETVAQQTEPEVPDVKGADKVEIVNFHATQRCYSCTTLGALSEKTIKEKFSDEIASGKVAFKAINVELPENKEIVELYQASGSSLYINAIKDGKNNIIQNVKVWQYIGDEATFTTYLETIVRSLL